MGNAANAIKNINELTRTAVVTGMRNASDNIQSTSRDVVREWLNKPDFSDEFTIQKTRIECLIKPKGNRKVVKIFGYVDIGTKGPYLIFPKVAGTYLKFRSGYSARTQPVAQYNKGSGQSFGSWVQSVGVIHPGIKPRLFMETTMKNLIPTLQQLVQNEITRSVA